MATTEERGRDRRAELEELVPGDSMMARVDRGAWAALSQGAPGTWSWGRVALTLVLGAIATAIFYLAVYHQLDWVIGLAIAYAFLLWRARAAHASYLQRRASYDGPR